MSADDMSRDPTDHDLERQLRAALRPVDPGAGFVGGVMARVAAERPHGAGASRWRATAPWLSLAAAASVVLALLVAHQQQLRRTEQGLEARRQLIQALRVTGDKLELVSRMVNEPPPRSNSADPGA
jgi:hypothetical protein